MKVTINGEIHSIGKPGMTITDLLVTENVESPEMLSVMLNREVVDRSLYNTTVIQENDEIDLLYFMGGGSIA